MPNSHIVVALLGFAMLSAPGPAFGLSEPDRSGELATISAASAPSTSVWAFTARPSWNTSRSFDVVGTTREGIDHVRVTYAGHSSWMIGRAEFAGLRRNSYSGDAALAAGTARARWVELDRERDRYQLTDSSYAIDSSARPDRVAAWVASTGSVTRSETAAFTTFRAVRSADIQLPPGVAAVFYPDRKNRIEVEVTTSAGQVVGYVFRNRSDIGPRSITVTNQERLRKVAVPSKAQLVKLSQLEDALEELNTPSSILPAVMADLDADVDQDTLRKQLKSRAKGIDIVVARTGTGFALYPEYNANSPKRLSEARCLVHGERWELRICGENDGAVLNEKFAPYAEYVRDLAQRLPLSPDQMYWAIDRLNHNLWLYSGLRFTTGEGHDWGWFMLDTLTRAELAHDCRDCDYGPVL
jgi:hypothetical protein